MMILRSPNSYVMWLPLMLKWCLHGSCDLAGAGSCHGGICSWTQFGDTKTGHHFDAPVCGLNAGSSIQTLHYFLCAWGH